MEKKPFSILWAEDEESARLLYFEELSDEGYWVFTAENGLQALGMLEDEKIDLLITDIKMPDMHAMELIPRVRAEYPQLPILVVSAFKGMEDDFALKGFNIDGFLSKPVNMDVLKMWVKNILEAKRQKVAV